MERRKCSGRGRGSGFGLDIDANAHVVYWNQDPSARFSGCLGRVNADGSDARCLDDGDSLFRGVRVDDSAVALGILVPGAAYSKA